MRKAAVFVFALSFVALPASVFADTLTPTQVQVQHLTAITAALEAQIQAAQGQSLACALVASQSTVAANQVFFLGWGSVGALAPGSISGQSMYPQEGVNEMSIQESGTWTYTFDFYGANGATTTCAAKIVVEAA